MSSPGEEEPRTQGVRPARPAQLPRTAKQVIDQAISDNQWGEWILYTFSVIFVLSGVSTLVVGMVRAEGLVALAGGVASALFYPAMHQARQIRRENIAIRLLERPLSMAETSKDAAEALKEFFVHTFIKRPTNP